MKFFDCLFLQIRKWYVSKREFDMPTVYAASILSLLQSLNGMAVFYILAELLPINLNHKFFVSFLIISVLIFNFFRYSIFLDARTIEKRCCDIVNNKKQKSKSVLYVIGSMILILSVTIYHRMHV